MLSVKKEGVIIKSSGLGFEADGVLNPAVFKEGNTVHIFYRAVATGNYSSIGYCKLDGPLTVIEQSAKPILYPQAEYEAKGTEDPRIVKIDGIYYLSYTAYDGVNALGALAISSDLISFEKQGLVTPQVKYEEFKHLAECKIPLTEKYIRYNRRDNIKTKHDKTVYVWIKNLVFFPRKINDEFHFLIRIKPDIQLVHIHDLDALNRDFWEKYLLQFCDNIAMKSKYDHESSYIGAGCPPIETASGWLIIYHGVHDSPKGYVYTVCAALLDLENPLKEIARLPYPLFVPEFDYELTGEVNNVCFPTGTALFEDILYIYYGAADDQIACASVSLKDLLTELMLNTIHHE